jgi:hypothetical protein
MSMGYGGLSGALRNGTTRELERQLAKAEAEEAAKRVTGRVTTRINLAKSSGGKIARHCARRRPILATSRRRSDDWHLLVAKRWRHHERDTDLH